MFGDVETAKEIERAECELLRAAAAVVGRRERDLWVHTIESGVGVFAGAGSPIDKVAGLGFGGFGAGDAAVVRGARGARRRLFARVAALLVEVRRSPIRTCRVADAIAVATVHRVRARARLTRTVSDT